MVVLTSVRDWSGAGHLLRLALVASSHMLSLSSVSLLHWHIASLILQSHRKIASGFMCRISFIVCHIALP